MPVYKFSPVRQRVQIEIDERDLRNRVAEMAAAAHKRAIDSMSTLKRGRMYRSRKYRGRGGIMYRVRGGIIYRGRGGIMYRASAPGEAPAVDTGNLKDHTDFEVQKLAAEATVGTTINAPYGLFLERGTARMRARPYMKPAIEAVMNARIGRKGDMKWLRVRSIS